MRLKLWKTNPIRRLRISARTSDVTSATSRPSNQYRPRLGWSRQPRIFIKVDFPDPDAPMTATNSPCSTIRLMPCNASTVTSPTRYTFQRSSQRIKEPMVVSFFLHASQMRSRNLDRVEANAVGPFRILEEGHWIDALPEAILSRQ